MASFRDLLGTTWLAWIIGEARIDASNLSAKRTQYIQDKDGTIALLADVSTGGGVGAFYQVSSNLTIPADNCLTPYPYLKINAGSTLTIQAGGMLCSKS